jgi:uncharacterized membrane protein YphA (DoxX/SURF4 family)
VVRLLAGLVFFAEGIKKFIFPTEWGIGRFEKIGIIYPHLSAPFVGVVETACGLLLIFGLFTRPAALLTQGSPCSTAIRISTWISVSCDFLSMSEARS